LCCKLLPIAELDKSPNVWCRHAEIGSGCAIHATKPSVCKSYVCDWLINAKLPEDWKPIVSRFVVSMTGEGNCSVVVDPGSPTAWRGERYYPILKAYAAQLLSQGKTMTVMVGERMIVPLPDRDMDLGPPIPGHRLEISVGKVHGWPRYSAAFVPRAAEQRP